MPWLNPETKKPGGLEPTGPYSLTSPAVPLAFAYQGQTSEPASPLKGAWMVSTFYGGGHSGVTSPENTAPKRLSPEHQDALIEAFKAWRAAGCLVHPATADGSKKAIGVEGGSKQRDENGRLKYGFARIRDGELPPFTLEQFEQMVRSGKTDGIGVFCGSPSNGVEMVEVEGRAAHLLEKVKQAAVERGCLPLLERLGNGCVEESPKGGFHFVLRVVGGPAKPDQILAQRPDPAEKSGVSTLAETSGQNQWFVAAPSGGRTHKTGKPYRFVRGGPETIPEFTPEERDQVYDCFRAIDEMPRRETPVVEAPRRLKRAGGPLTAGQDFNVRGWSWERIMTGCPKPWKADGQPSQQQADDGGLVEYRQWTRPGKSGGTSATTTGGILRSFTSSTALPQYVSPTAKGEPGRNALTKFAAYAHLYHKPSGNPDDEPDWAAASRALAELGFGSDGLDDFEPVVVETLPDRGPVRDLAEWRQEVAVERALALRMPGLHLDRSPTGSGKTYATTRAIVEAVEATRREAEFDDSVVPITRTLTVLPDHANIRERVREMRAAGLDAAAFPARDETTCGNLDAVRRAEGLGLTAGATICAAPCPLRDTCLFNQQLKQAEEADHAVATHERLRLSPGSLTKDRQVIVIDETPEQVLAPSITVRVDDFNPVVGLASTVRDDYLFRYGRPMEPTADERAFAAYLTESHSLIVEAARAATEPGVVEIPLPPPAEVPKDWQKTFLRWAVETNVHPGHDRHKQERFQKAVRLLTMIVTGKIERLHLLVDQTSRHEKQADGTVREWNPLHHFVVGTWKTKLPFSTTPVVCLDATATADDLRAATGLEVHDCTPEGHLPNVAPVVQIPWDVTAGQSSKTAAGFVEAFLTAHPEVERLGLIGHQDHVREMMADDGVLPARLRARVAKSCWFGAGPDRASNDWHDACDALLVVGTMRPGGGPVKQRLVSHGKYDAARRGSEWGVRHWDATTTDGRPYRGEGKGYLDPEWHQAHAAISRAAVHQAVGRGRSITEKGIPVWIISDEPMGVPVDDSLQPVSPIIREVVEAVRSIRDGSAGTELFPIRDTYRRKFGSLTAVRVSAVIQLLQTTTGKRQKQVGQRAVEKRLALALRHGRLERPAKGWLIVVGDEPATVPEQVVGPPATVSRTEPAVVITATGPATAAPVLEVVARSTPETTTSVSTATAPPDPAPLVTALVDETDERAAIMEFDGHLDAATADRLARETVMGRNVVSPVAPAEPVGVDHVALAARLHPFVDAAVQRFGGPVRVISPEEDPFSTGWGVRATAAARPEGIVCRCGSREVVEVWFHDGQSSRDDCANCGKFVRHTRWHGKPVGPPVVVPPVQADEPPSSPNRLSFLVPIPAAMLVGAVE